MSVYIYMVDMSDEENRGLAQENTAQWDFVNLEDMVNGEEYDAIQQAIVKHFPDFPWEEFYDLNSGLANSLYFGEEAWGEFLADNPNLRGSFKSSWDALPRMRELIEELPHEMFYEKDAGTLYLHGIPEDVFGRWVQPGDEDYDEDRSEDGEGYYEDYSDWVSVVYFNGSSLVSKYTREYLSY